MFSKGRLYQRNQDAPVHESVGQEHSQKPCEDMSDNHEKKKQATFIALVLSWMGKASYSLLVELHVNMLQCHTVRIILPSKNRFMPLLVKHRHERTSHQG